MPPVPNRHPTRGQDPGSVRTRAGLPESLGELHPALASVSIGLFLSLSSGSLVPTTSESSRNTQLLTKCKPGLVSNSQTSLRRVTKPCSRNHLESRVAVQQCGGGKALYSGHLDGLAIPGWNRIPTSGITSKNSDQEKVFCSPRRVGCEVAVTANSRCPEQPPPPGRWDCPGGM